MPESSSLFAQSDGIVVLGKRGSGKTSIVKFLIKILSDPQYNFRFSLMDIVGNLQDFENGTNIQYYLVDPNDKEGVNMVVDMALREGNQMVVLDEADRYRHYETTKLSELVNVGRNFNCIPYDTTILGDNKAISDFNIGNKVIGQHGHSIVKNTFIRPYNGDIIKIKANGMLPLLTTPEHPLLVSENKTLFNNKTRKFVTFFSDLEWLESKKLKAKHWNSNGNYVVLPRILGDTSITEISLITYLKSQKHLKRMITQKQPTSFPLNEDTAWLLGLYVAEGCDAKTKVVFTLNKNELTIQNRLKSIIKVLGYSPNEIKEKNNQTTHIQINSKLLARAFSEWCGHLAINKKIPDFILLHKNENILKSFLAGYVVGDGCVTSDKRDGRKSLVIRTVSRLLAQQTQLAYARLGKFVNLQMFKLEGDKIINGHKAHIHNAYHIIFPLVRIRKYTKIFKDYFLVPVRSVETLSYEGKVSNIETEDNTYIVSNCVTHNCGYIATARRTANLDKDYIVNANWVIIFKHTWPEDIDRIVEWLSVDENTIRSLKPFEFLLIHDTEVIGKYKLNLPKDYTIAPTEDKEPDETKETPETPVDAVEPTESERQNEPEVAPSIESEPSQQPQEENAKVKWP